MLIICYGIFEASLYFGIEIYIYWLFRGNYFFLRVDFQEIRENYTRKNNLSFMIRITGFYFFQSGYNVRTIFRDLFSIVLTFLSRTSSERVEECHVKCADHGT